MDQHPFRVWREAAKLSRQEAADRVRAALVGAGRDSSFSPEHLSHIENGIRGASRTMAQALSLVTGGTVRPGDIMAWVRPVAPAPAPAVEPAPAAE